MTTTEYAEEYSVMHMLQSWSSLGRKRNSDLKSNNQELSSMSNDRTGKGHSNTGTT